MPYESIDEAIEIANATRYALGASVFGPDKYECLEVAKRLECGMVAVNDFGVFYVSTTYSAEFLTAYHCTQLKYVDSATIVFICSQSLLP
jgi:acyl-CoA reductase-like NAD-dependent aldehyde dehydrogenase